MNGGRWQAASQGCGDRGPEQQKRDATSVTWGFKDSGIPTCVSSLSVEAQMEHLIVHLGNQIPASLFPAGQRARRGCLRFVTWYSSALSSASLGVCDE